MDISGNNATTILDNNKVMKQQMCFEKCDVFEKYVVLYTNDVLNFVQDTNTGIDVVLGRHIKRRYNAVSKKKIARWFIKEI